MTISTYLRRTTRYTVLSGLFIIVSMASLKAGDRPDSVSAIIPSLADGVSLDGKVVYLDFWASWCVPCRHSFPWMEEMYHDYKDKGLVIIGVNVDKDHKAALKFLESSRATFPMVFDSTGALAGQFGLEAMPSSFLFGRDGMLVATHRGFRVEDADSLQTVISMMLEKEVGP